MRFEAAAVLLAAALAVAGCQTPPTPEPLAALTPTQIWTTPPEPELPRLERERDDGVEAITSTWRHDAELTFASRYVWRGQLVTDDPVLQPSANVHYGDARFNVWANLDLTDVNGDAGEFNEVDLTLEWKRAFNVGPFDLEPRAGVIAYFFPNMAVPNTAELYAGVGAAVLGNPALTVYQDVDANKGNYLSADIAESLALGPVTLEGTAGIGWGSRAYNRGYFRVDSDGLNDFHAMLSAPISRGRWTIKPFVAWQSMVASRIRAATARSDLFIAGLVVGASL